MKDFTSSLNLGAMDVTFFFRAGSAEFQGMHAYMRRLEQWLHSFNNEVDNRTLPGGHEFAVWSTALNETIPLAFATPNSNPSNPNC